MGVGGVGWVIRDSVESLIIADCKLIKKEWSIMDLEALAIKEGLSHYLNSCGHIALSLIIESDSQEVINHSEKGREDCDNGWSLFVQLVS